MRIWPLGFWNALIDLSIRPFVVTNCSKERTDSVVTETLKNGILIPIVTSKEFNFMLVLNIQVSSSLVLLIKSYKPEKICLILENRRKHPLKIIKSEQKSQHQIQRIRQPSCRCFKLLSTKMWNFVFFARRQITDACLFVVFFSRSDRINTVVLECHNRTHSKRN